MMKKIEFKTTIFTDIEYKEGLVDFYDYIMSLDKESLQDLILWRGNTFIVDVCDEKELL